ncbi:MAG TPA: OmpA family protein [Cyclobacteriaceae bacterium]|nr:OmpA family protein [Cyclobacteriaceae bacterium]
MKALLTIVTIVVAITNNVYSRDTNYVVIGAFSVKDNAVQLAVKARAELEINPAKQLYYVFVMKTEDHQQALNEATRLRSQTEYKDAWVFFGTLGEGGKGVDIVSLPDPAPVVIEERKEEPREEPKEEPKETPKPKEELPPSPADAKSKPFYFNVVRDDGTKPTGAEITVVDPITQRKEYVLAGNENITLKAINKTGDLRLECDLAGYRKIVQTINFKDPTTADGITIVDNRVVVPFHLVRLKKGDFSILYNVFFYKDAAIMRPESKFDLDGLLAMMNEGPNYKIRIHGHTNGNASGPIYEPGESGNLFSLTGAKEGNGSAKKLSEKRATVIRDYLVQNGVDAARMSVKAWGGKKPIYDKHHTQASANVRVEVEVLEE